MVIAPRIADDALIIPLIAFKIRIDGNILSVYTGIPDGGPVASAILCVPVDDQVPVSVVIGVHITFHSIPRRTDHPVRQRIRVRGRIVGGKDASAGPAGA